MFAFFARGTQAAGPHAVAEAEVHDSTLAAPAVMTMGDAGDATGDSKPCVPMSTDVEEWLVDAEDV